MKDIVGCVADIASAMIEILDKPNMDVRPILKPDYIAALPEVEPTAILLQLRVCYGGYPKLKVKTVKWESINHQPYRQTLYQVVARPGRPPVYFTVTKNNTVRRIRPLLKK